MMDFSMELEHLFGQMEMFTQEILSMEKERVTEFSIFWMEECMRVS